MATAYLLLPSAIAGVLVGAISGSIAVVLSIRNHHCRMETIALFGLLFAVALKNSYAIIVPAFLVFAAFTFLLFIIVYWVIKAVYQLLKQMVFS